MELLEELNEKGKTIVMVTHDPNDAAHADRVIEIIDGVTGHGDLEKMRQAGLEGETG